MVFNPNGVGPNGDTVTFYVFGADGNLLNFAALDGEGKKSVPRMCMPRGKLYSGYGWDVPLQFQSS
jgi:hypothetical protein